MINNSGNAYKHLNSEHQQAYLHLLHDIYEISTALGTQTYIWGGMVIDILCGEFLRVHNDIDGFTLNLLSVKDKMTLMFSDRGYKTSYASAYDMLKIEKDDFHAAFNRLEVDGDSAMWRHVGEQGTITFPTNGLDKTPRSFYGVKCYISGIRFEYAIKTNALLLNPEWWLRDKDRFTINYLKTELARNNIRESDVISQISSFTPYWIQKGYPEYSKRLVPGDGRLAIKR